MFKHYWRFIESFKRRHHEQEKEKEKDKENIQQETDKQETK